MELSDLLIGMRLSVMIFFVWLFFLTLRFHADVQRFWAGVFLYAAIVLFVSPEHIMRLSGGRFEPKTLEIMMVCGNACFLLCAWLLIGSLTERTGRANTKRIILVGTMVTLGLSLAVGIL